ncbi:hypothetical protein NPIL_611901 [Nephila pilipes]|uniref:Uncharacterized protein n=1 Tax=Nephila pilipes TaxID=299642 RepID=A0A8X6U1V6_NEPPI|nr:hypothetical protein NPIL_611901 [Nephila pilipes]
MKTINSSKAEADMRELRRVTGMLKGKGLLIQSSVQRMVKKFEETESFTVKYGYGRKLVPLPIRKKIATVIAENSGTPEVC